MPKKSVQQTPLRAKPRQWPAFVALTKYATLAASRNVATVAFGFIFPLVFISVFGLLGNGSTTIKLGICGQTDKNPVVAVLQKIEVVKIQAGSCSDLASLLTKGKIDGVAEFEAGLVAPGERAKTGGYQVLLSTTKANPSTGSAVASIVQGVVDKLNLQLAGVTKPAITVSQKQTAGRESRYIDYALPGMIGFALLSTAIFGTVFGFISLKRTLVLKRMFATPTKTLTFLLAQGTSRLFFALAQTVIIVGFGVLAFHFYLPHGWLTFVEVLILSSLGLVAFLGFGYFMAGFANDENSANPLVNLVTLPQFLLSGVFFSTDGFPSWVQPIANNLPLSYFNLAMRKITTEGGHLTDVWGYVLGLLAWGLVMYLLATKTFKWE